MAIILNIDTSSSICSVAISKDGEIIMGLESALKMDHSRSLAPNVNKCLEFLLENNLKLEGVSVTNGPGSYTGLRIGLSLAKGIAYGMDIPLITLSSLLVMAVRGIFSYENFSGEELIVPMIDARRMEVYSSIYDSGLNLLTAEAPLILDENSYTDLPNDKKILFIGDGTEKFKEIYNKPNCIWLGKGMPHAKYMAALSEKYFNENKFSDIAYSTPSYLKEYQTTISKKNL